MSDYSHQEMYRSACLQSLASAQEMAEERQRALLKRARKLRVKGPWSWSGRLFTCYHPGKPTQRVTAMSLEGAYRAWMDTFGEPE